MKKMTIYDPAMCCSTGVCGPSVDPELLRVSTVINRLKGKGVVVQRHNLTSNPKAFVEDKKVNELLKQEGIDVLPVTTVEGRIVKTGAYPSNEEFCSFLEVSTDYLKPVIKKPSSKGCGCKGGCC